MIYTPRTQRDPPPPVWQQVLALSALCGLPLGAIALVASCSAHPVPEQPDAAADRAALVRLCPASSDIVMRTPEGRLLLHRVWADDRWIAPGVTPEQACP